jgi:hypothetical protein
LLTRATQIALAREKELQLALDPIPKHSAVNTQYAQGVDILKGLTWHRLIGSDTCIVLADPATLHNNPVHQVFMRHGIFSGALPMENDQRFNPPIQKSEQPFFDREFSAGRHYKFAISGAAELETLAKLGCIIPPSESVNPASRPVTDGKPDFRPDTPSR